MEQEKGYSGQGAAEEEEITRRSVLLECLRTEELKWKNVSIGCRMLEPIKGLEKDFERQRRKCELLRDMIRACETEPVRRALAEWQIELMAGKEPDLKL